MGTPNFRDITGLNFDVISTVDHPYTSPPIRLLDSHRRLLNLQGKRVCVLNWDVTLPNDRTYRYDLQFDAAFLAKVKNIFIFNLGIPYALQEGSNVIDLDLHERLFNKSLSIAKDEMRIDQHTIDFFTGNYLILRDRVLENVVKDNHLVSEYTRQILVDFYSAIGLNDLREFISCNYLYYYKSAIHTKWIPSCIENAIGKRALHLVIEKESVFSRRAFRSASKHIDDSLINSLGYIKNSKNELCDYIRAGEIIPSIEVLYWSLEIANKLHYGNDYGFYSRYAKYLGEQLNNQITEMYGDGENIVELEEDFGISLSIDGDGIVRNKNNAPNKKSRINSMFAVYILLGSDLNKFIDNPGGRVGFQDGRIKVTR